MEKQVGLYWNISVKVLRAKINKAYDYVTQNDLVVTLHLPTASACTLRTKTISNCNTPEWNETFYFCVHSLVKNILELNVYDSDVGKDDLCAAILFDISTLTMNEKVMKRFITDEKLQDEIWVEFFATESKIKAPAFFSNGVLMAGPMSTIDVNIEKLPTHVQHDILLKLRGAYKEDQMIPVSKDSGLMQTLRYYVNKSLKTEIEVLMQNEHEKQNEAVSVPLTLVSPTQELQLSLPVVKDTVNLQLNVVDSSNEELKVRLDFDIPEAEKAFLVKRKLVVSRALRKVLKLKDPLDPNKVPTVAAVFSGGSTRAMTATHGSLRGLQKLGLLDAISYITTVSGSTWAASNLYSNPSWSETDLDKIIAPMQNNFSRSVASLFSPSLLKFYYSEVRQRQTEGHSISAIDMWGLILENLIFGKKYPGTLADQKRAVLEGQNPLPIYTAVNMKNTGGSVVPEWCEYTPFEVGLLKYGAFVPSENFGSEYYLGHLVKKLSETRIAFLLGTWSSVFSTNLSQLWHLVTGSSPSWISWLGEHVDSIETDGKRSTLDTMRVDSEASTLSNLFSGRPFISHVFNFMRGFFLHNMYSENDAFNTTDEKHPDAFPNKLTPADTSLSLVDAGFAINAAFPPVLRNRRKADIILFFEYSWDTDIFQCVKTTQQYCKENQIPFPNTDFSKLSSEPLREAYVFEDEGNAEAPIVILFPLVSVSFKDYRAPGVKRKGEKELQDGVIDVSTTASPYVSSQLTFTSKDFQKLVDLTTYNAVNNKETIIQAMRKAVNKKMQICN